jgi:curved DNA-binding protein CbpA
LSEVYARTPKLVEERIGGLREIPLSPTDGFILSRIDGASDEQQIVAVTGLSDEEVRSSLAKLELLGVITFGGAVSAPSPGPALSAPSKTTAEPISPTPASSETTAHEDVDMDPETRRSIVETHRRLDDLDHYELLGVDRMADKKALRRAYFDLAARFHPDRYFRKKLGSYKLRMEVIFGRLTLAHETLSDAGRRDEYDAYLEEQREARGIEQLMADATSEAKRAEESIEREARAQASLDGLASSSPAPAPAPRAAAVSPAPEVGVAARRDALARRLLGGASRAQVVSSASSTPPTGTSGPAQTAPSISGAMDALRRRYEERVSRAKAAQSRKYMATAEEALARGDAVSAANAFRVAQTLSPNEPELQRKAQEALEKADSVLSDMYTRQATYEEKNGQWAEAARSWTRVTKARPADAEAHARAADALAKAGGDLHEAQRLATAACALEPKKPAYRVVLADVYMAAGLTLNARRELEAAAQLSPQDDTIRAMMNRIGSRG